MRALIAAAISLTFACSPAFAGPQQEKMKTCNADATGKKGDERKAFMKDCLSAHAAAPAKVDHKQRMRDCNIQSKGKKGEERKTFMSNCLSN